MKPGDEAKVGAAATEELSIPDAVMEVHAAADGEGAPIPVNAGRTVGWGNDDAVGAMSNIYTKSDDYNSCNSAVVQPGWEANK